MRKFFFILIAPAIILTSCATSSLRVHVMKPAEITLPSDIKKVALINRSLPDDDSKVMNVIEGVLTGEGIFVDREGSERCIMGLYDQLGTTDRFTAILPKDVEKYKGNGGRNFPPPLKWGDVKGICDKSGADALISLEVFDSDQGVKISEEKRSGKNKEGQPYDYFVKVAHLDQAVSAGWRVYDPVKEKIIDQNIFTDHKHFDADGPDEVKARANLPLRRETVKQTGYYAGGRYGIRISPVWVWVNRVYYVKGNDDFADAKFKVRAQAWKEAAEIWQRHVNSSDPKIAGRATYNMALANEVMGDLTVALDWAKKSYKDYYNKKARTYIHELENRIYDQRRLQEQMGE